MRAALRKVAGEGAVGAGGTRAVGAGGARAAGAGGARAVGALGLLVVALVVGVVAWPSGAGGPTPDPHVVRVMADPPTGPAVLATGFEARPGRVVTVAHILDGNTELAVRRADGARPRTRVLRIDRRNDLALLAVAGHVGAPDAPAAAPDPVAAAGRRSRGERASWSSGRGAFERCLRR